MLTVDSRAQSAPQSCWQSVTAVVRRLVRLDDTWQELDSFGREKSLVVCPRAPHNLDVTGEIPVIEAAAQRHQRAVAAGASLIPAVGFDVVPSDCLAAMLAQRLPGAIRLALACMERVLAGAAPVGFSTPSKAFGADFVLQLPGTRLR